MIMQEKKECSTCGKRKPFDDFYKDRRKPDGLYSSCRICHNIRTARWNNENPEVCHVANLKCYHSFTKEEYQALHDHQAGKCIRCGKAESLVSKNGNPWHLTLRTNPATGEACLTCRACHTAFNNQARKSG